jgi:hypothetical protein
MGDQTLYHLIWAETRYMWSINNLTLIQKLCNTISTRMEKGKSNSSRCIFDWTQITHDRPSGKYKYETILDELLARFRRFSSLNLCLGPVPNSY